jgi:hypothetical protein
LSLPEARFTRAAEARSTEPRSAPPSPEDAHRPQRERHGDDVEQAPPDAAFLVFEVVKQHPDA